jgi:hypothetical protein
MQLQIRGFKADGRPFEGEQEFTEVPRVGEDVNVPGVGWAQVVVIGPDNTVHLGRARWTRN